MDDLDFGATNPTSWIAGEEKYAGIARDLVVVHLGCDPQTPVNVALIGSVDQSATDIVQVFANLVFAEIFDVRFGCATVVPRYFRSLLH